MYRNYCQVGQFIKLYIYTNQSVILKTIYANHLIKRWAGHSKWQNIKSTKELHDRIKSNKFLRLSRLMVNAARNGGENISQNTELRRLMEEAQKINMPKATIQRALAQARSQTSERPYWTVFSGPRGFILAFEVVFANSKRPFLASKFPQAKRLNLKMEAHYENLCSEKGIVITEFLENVEKSYEKALEDAIEIGVNEVYETDNKQLIFECLPDRLDSVCQQLSKRGYIIQSASNELEFTDFVNLTEDEIQGVEAFINKVQSQNEEILRACHNAADPLNC